MLGTNGSITFLEDGGTITGALNRNCGARNKEGENSQPLLDSFTQQGTERGGRQRVVQREREKASERKSVWGHAFRLD